MTYGNRRHEVTTTQSYILGFVSGCARHGVDPVALAKSAGVLSSSIMEDLANAQLLMDLTNDDLKQHIGAGSARRSSGDEAAGADVDVDPSLLADEEKLRAIMRRVEERRRRREDAG